MAGGISKQTKAELLAALRSRYGGSSKKGKGRILDEFVAVSGYHRKHAIRLLSSRASPGGSLSVETQSAAGCGRRIYDEAVTEALIVLWEAADRICGKRLKAILPDLIAALERHGHLELDDRVHVRRQVRATEEERHLRLDEADVRGGRQGEETGVMYRVES